MLLSMEAVKVVLLLLVVGSMMVHPSQGQLTITRESSSIMNNSQIVVANALFGDLRLQCNYAGVENVSWVVLPDNDALMVFDGSTKGITGYDVSGSGSQVTLTIQNNVALFRGLLKCLSTSGEALSIQVVPSTFAGISCPEDLDLRWRILWRATFTDRRDAQPCPTDGSPTQGFALRRCLSNGTWESTIDISGCSTQVFESLRVQAIALKTTNVAQLPTRINSFIETEFMTATTVKANNNTHFPRDLSISNEAIGNVLEAMRMTSGNEFPSLVGIFNNLLHPANTEGWLQLSLTNGGVQLLNNIDLYGEFLVNVRPNTTSDTFTSDVASESFATFRVMRMLETPYSTFMYPSNMNLNVPQVTIPSNLLLRVDATGLVVAILPTIYGILPTPDLSSSVSARIATTVISTQIFNAEGSVTNFVSDSPVVFNFRTQLLRSRNPTCVFLDPTTTTAPTTNWSTAGLVTAVTATSGAEFKQFDVDCSSFHLTSFAVAVEETTTEFEITIPVYIGCAFIIISGAISLLTLMLSCILDGYRKYFLSGYVIHMSFAISLLCASIVFLAGITMGLSSEASCQAVSGLLLYFFTASFSWLFCEVMMIVCFGVISRNWCLVILIFLTGWGLPAISTAVTAGLLYKDFGSTTQCWVFFDGNVSSSVFLGFLVPKLILVAMCFFLLSVSCCTTYKLTYEKIQPFLKKYIVRLLWFIWVSTIILVACLSVSWVFLLLFVNAFATDLSLSQWVFMGASIALGIWMFIFNAVVVIVSQKVDYERLWTKKESVYVEADPGKGSGYEFMSMSSAVDLSGRRSNRSSIVVGPPSTFPTDNPVFS